MIDYRHILHPTKQLYIYNQSSRRLICCISFNSIDCLIDNLDLPQPYLLVLLWISILKNQLVILENFVQVETGFCDFIMFVQMKLYPLENMMESPLNESEV